MADSSSAPHLERNIGLTGATALVVGAVVGAGIFVLIGDISDASGGAIWLAFAIAIAVSISNAVPLVQLASALPRAGAGYFFASRLTTPMIGTITSMWILLGGACSTCVASLAFGEYVVAVTVPEPSHHWVYGCSIGVVILFYLVYLFGVRLAMGIQVVFAAQLILAFIIYCAVGLTKVDIQATLVPPGGFSAEFLITLVLCYNTCLGFGILAEIAEEVKDASRNIPIALLLGGIIVGGLFILIGMVYQASFALVDSHPEEIAAPLGYSAALFLSGPLVAFLGLGAITAGLTSINAGAVALPREIFAQARDGILPAWFGHVDARTHTPLNAVTTFIIMVVAFMGLGWIMNLTIDHFSYVTVVGILVATSAICVASLWLRRRYPEELAAAYVQLPQWLIVGCTLLTVVASVGLALLMFMEAPPVIIIFTALTIVSAIYHKQRVKWLEKQGIDFQERVHAIPESGEGS